MTRAAEPRSGLTASDRQEIIDFADLLRAKAGLAPKDEMPDLVCALDRTKQRSRGTR